ncbi:tail protein [Gordonia phage Catfish]|uniref:Tail fiber protein n=1 Tax=Gordonia phage Catfish TaxID=2301538 RepID=A0A385D1F9_9CAUD|nr:tail protein [Gordonia phage Catfish]AXQ51854.1 tail fiber protein [Gordonia phage Catfish]
MSYTRPNITNSSTRANRAFFENILDGVDEALDLADEAADLAAEKLGKADAEAKYAPRVATYQSQLLARAMQKFRKGQPVKLVCRGDSTTYGHDTVSSDKVPPPAGTLPDGTSHSFTRSPKPFPAAMQDFLNETYPGNIVTVENQGFSGDWVQRGFTKWSNSVNADITVISYGINDESATSVPEGIRGNVVEYIAGLEKMILRDLSWGSAVVLLAPIRQRGATGSAGVDAYRNALRGLAAAYGIPLVDTEDFLVTAPWDCWSDGNHLNTKGNSIMGARLASLFVGEGPLHRKVVESGSKLLGRPTLDNLVLNGMGVTQSSGFGTPRDESTMSQGTAVGLSGGGSSSMDAVATWSFYTESPDVFLLPWSYINGNFAGEAGASITYELDYGVEQGQNYHVDIATPGQSGNGTRAASRTVHGPLATGTPPNYVQDPVTNTLGIRVATPGWHTIRAKFHRTVLQSVTVTHMIEAFAWRTIQEMRKPVDYSPIVSSLSAAHVAVPATYDESADITVTKVKWPALTQALGVKPWGVGYYAAPVIKLTLRTYGVGVVEYAFLCTQTPDQAGSDAVARSVDNYLATEYAGSVSFVRKLGAGFATVSAGNPPETHTSGRELAHLAYEAATQSLVFTWRTQNSGDAQAKYLRKNFVMSFSLY